jgi:hypothetical protein
VAFGRQGAFIVTQFWMTNPRVMHETIEGEVILIHLDTGTYYSLRATGAEIWQALQLGAGRPEIVDALAAAYDGSHDEIRSAVTGLIEQLQDEGLIESRDGVASPETPSFAAAGGSFRPPVLEKHTDMQDLIVLDPVHEVGAQGWPHREERNG